MANEKNQEKTNSESYPLQYRYFVDVNTGELLFQHPVYKGTGLKPRALGKLSQDDRHEYGVYLR